jgi:hypothetical protein
MEWWPRDEPGPRETYGTDGMQDKTLIVRLKRPQIMTVSVKAVRAEIEGDHLLLFDSLGSLAALFLIKLVESWHEVQNRG